MYWTLASLASGFWVQCHDGKCKACQVDLTQSLEPSSQYYLLICKSYAHLYVCCNMNCMFEIREVTGVH